MAVSSTWTTPILWMVALLLSACSKPPDHMASCSSICFTSDTKHVIVSVSRTKSDGAGLYMAEWPSGRIIRNSRGLELGWPTITINSAHNEAIVTSDGSGFTYAVNLTTWIATRQQILNSKDTQCVFAAAANGTFFAAEAESTTDSTPILHAFSRSGDQEWQMTFSKGSWPDCLTVDAGANQLFLGLSNVSEQADAQTNLQPDRPRILTVIPQTRAISHIYELTSSPSCICYSPGGDRLAYAVRDDVNLAYVAWFTVDIATSATNALGEKQRSITTAGDFSPDGTLFAHNTIFGVSVHGINSSATFTSHSVELPSGLLPRTIKFAPSGQLLLVGDNQGNIWTWDYRGDNSKPQTWINTGRHRDSVFSLILQSKPSSFEVLSGNPMDLNDSP
ncbi:MAG: WD40 repeat domain-containing protein [Candidatus Sumerlaeaceae bacterium]|nr:WD40 repeat domain-containing protein [Candidatus Sumerlaeaceae bacterium]